MVPSTAFALWARTASCALLLALTGYGVALAGEPRNAVPIASRTFQVSDGVRLHVLEGGPTRGAAADRPVLAFVTGWSMPAAIWEGQLQAFGSRYRVAALDPRGQGLSDIAQDGYSADRRADDVAEFVARYPRVVLIGWSLGALEVLHYVHRHGDARVVAMVLVDSSVGEEPPPPPGDFKDSLRRDREGTLRSFVQAIFRTPRPQAEQARLLAGALRMPLEASIELLSWPLVRTHWRDIAWAFRKPLLYVVTPQFAEQSANLARNRPGTQVELFSDAGHTLFVDEPQRFNKVLQHFVETVSTAR